jgi:hypothetical protein
MTDMKLPEARKRVRARWGRSSIVRVAPNVGVWDAYADADRKNTYARRAHADNYPSESSALRAVVAAVEAEG